MSGELTTCIAYMCPWAHACSPNIIISLIHVATYIQYIEYLKYIGYLIDAYVHDVINQVTFGSPILKMGDQF